MYVNGKSFHCKCELKKKLQIKKEKAQAEVHNSKIKVMIGTAYKTIGGKHIFLGIRQNTITASKVKKMMNWMAAPCGHKIEINQRELVI